MFVDLTVVRSVMSAVAEAPLPIQMTDAAANKVKTLITEEENPELKLRVYITGGGLLRFPVRFHV